MTAQSRRPGQAARFGRVPIAVLVTALLLVVGVLAATPPTAGATPGVASTTTAVPSTSSPATSPATVGTTATARPLATASATAGATSSGKGPGRTKTFMALIATGVLAALAAVFVFIRSQRENAPEQAE
ncbi:hypothetical protein FAM19024_001908 [Propionibacterium freudenreichii]|uniref:hypothetical protein n=1 Tax=Propionibacterium freudenreichii TaxID=1744 RepID=UPI0024345814|nr:hypothetical protein [Propionibacterium freudenreichii]WFF32444.1 hypothetical protein FAM19024_001908 [Propionibacterium freudenreichii]